MISGTSASDERLKTDIHPFNLGLNELMGIEPKLFKYNGLGEHPASRQAELGMIAQQEKTAPSLVVNAKVKMHPDDKTLAEIKQVNYTALIYVVINSVKELYHKLTDADQKFVEVKREIASVKAENASLKEQAEKFAKEQQTQEKEISELKARLEKIEATLKNK